MRNLVNCNHYRDIKASIEHYGDAGDHERGVFSIISVVDGGELKVIANNFVEWAVLNIMRFDRYADDAERDQVTDMFCSKEDSVFSEDLEFDRRDRGYRRILCFVPKGVVAE